MSSAAALTAVCPFRGCWPPPVPLREGPPSSSRRSRNMIASAGSKPSAVHKACTVPRLGRRRPTTRLHTVLGSTCARRARCARVQPRRRRSRSSISTLTDHATGHLAAPECDPSSGWSWAARFSLMSWQRCQTRRPRPGCRPLGGDWTGGWSASDLRAHSRRLALRPGGAAALRRWDGTSAWPVSCS